MDTKKIDTPVEAYYSDASDISGDFKPDQTPLGEDPIDVFTQSPVTSPQPPATRTAENPLWQSISELGQQLVDFKFPETINADRFKIANAFSPLAGVLYLLSYADQLPIQMHLTSLHKDVHQKLKAQFQAAYSYDANTHTLSVKDEEEVKGLSLFVTFLQSDLHDINSNFNYEWSSDPDLLKYLNLSHPDLTPQDRSYLYVFYFDPENFKKVAAESYADSVANMAAFDGLEPLESSPAGRSAQLVSGAIFESHRFDFNKLFETVCANWDEAAFTEALESADQRTHYFELKALSLNEQLDRYNGLNTLLALPGRLPNERRIATWEVFLLQSLFIEQKFNFMELTAKSWQEYAAENLGVDELRSANMMAAGFISITPHLLDDLTYISVLKQKYLINYFDVLQQSPTTILSSEYLNDLILNSKFLFVNLPMQHGPLLSLADLAKIRLELQKRKIVSDLSAINTLSDVFSTESQAIKANIDDILDVLPNNYKMRTPAGLVAEGEFIDVKEFIRRHMDYVMIVPDFDHFSGAATVLSAFAIAALNGSTLARFKDSSPSMQSAYLMGVLLHEAAHVKFYREHFEGHIERANDLVVNERFAHSLERAYWQDYLRYNQPNPADRSFIQSLIDQKEQYIRYANTVLGLECEDYTPYLWHANMDAFVHDPRPQIAHQAEGLVWPTAKPLPEVVQRPAELKVRELSALMVEALAKVGKALTPAETTELQQALEKIYATPDDEIISFEPMHPLMQIFNTSQPNVQPIGTSLGRLFKMQLDNMLSVNQKVGNFWTDLERQKNNLMTGVLDSPSFGDELDYETLSYQMETLPPPYARPPEAHDLPVGLAQGLKRIYMLLGSPENEAQIIEDSFARPDAFWGYISNAAYYNANQNKPLCR